MLLKQQKQKAKKKKSKLRDKKFVNPVLAQLSKTFISHSLKSIINRRRASNRVLTKVAAPEICNSAQKAIGEAMESSGAVRRSNSRKRIINTIRELEKKKEFLSLENKQEAESLIKDLKSLDKVDNVLAPSITNLSLATIIIATVVSNVANPIAFPIGLAIAGVAAIIGFGVKVKVDSDIAQAENKARNRFDINDNNLILG